MTKIKSRTNDLDLVIESEVWRFAGLSKAQQALEVMRTGVPDPKGKKKTSSDGGLFSQEDLASTDSSAAWLKAAEMLSINQALGILLRPDSIRAVQAWIWDAFSPPVDSDGSACRTEDKSLSFDTRVLKSGVAWIENKGKRRNEDGELVSWTARRGARNAREFKESPCTPHQRAHREEVVEWAHWMMHRVEGPFGSNQVCLSQGVCPDTLRDALDAAYPWFVEIAQQYEDHLRRMEAKERSEH